MPPVRYIKSKVKSVYKKLVKKEPKKTDNEVYNEEKLKRKSIGELKEIAKLRRIKNMGKLKKEGLITSILKSEISNAERSYMKHFHTNVDNTTNADANDDTYDAKIKDKIGDTKVILSRLGDIVTKGDRVKIKKKQQKKTYLRPTKRLSRLLRGITSNHDGDFYCLSCLHSFRTDNALKKQERLCENNDYCIVEMPTKINTTQSRCKITKNTICNLC